MKLPKVVIELIAAFLQKFELLPWIVQEKLNIAHLALNPNAIDFLEDHVASWWTKINWGLLCQNKEAMHLIEQHLECVDWYSLSANPAAIHLLQAYPENIVWPQLSRNPAAIELLSKNQGKIDWTSLSLNPKAIDLLQANMERISWSCLSRNPAALDLLKKNQDRIQWYALASNPEALPLLEQNLDKVDWDDLSKNPAAGKLLLANKDKISWYHSHTFEAAQYVQTHTPNEGFGEWWYFVANPFAISWLQHQQITVVNGNYYGSFSQNTSIFQLQVPSNVLSSLQKIFL